MDNRPITAGRPDTDRTRCAADALLAVLVVLLILAPCLVTGYAR